MLLAHRCELQGLPKLPCQATDLLFAVGSFGKDLLSVNVVVPVIASGSSRSSMASWALARSLACDVELIAWAS
eukprot:830529-Karenia_brevis.AAC.1